MQCCFASFNTKGFQSSISHGSLPEPDHITYEGAFNELPFTIGKKAKKSMELHIGYSKCQNINSSFDSEIHDYLAIFTKGSKDGQDRDNRILNSVICLDISGSMSSGLTRSGQGQRLGLAKQAIKMYFSKMRPNDAFGLVVFDDKGDTLIPCQLKSQLSQEQVFAQIDVITTRGGTTLLSGFNKARDDLVEFMKSQNYSKNNASQNRILMLTDVGDNSVAGAKNFIENVSKSDNIHTTIIGISDDFVSSTCEQLNQIQGFNYFCATQVSDLKKYLFQNFNFTFFPANYDIQIDLVDSKNIKDVQVFGTVDAKKVKQYNSGFFKSITSNLTITKTKTSFPSEIQISKEGDLKQFGGLIIVKLHLAKPNQNKFQAKVKLSYRTPKGQKEEQVYPISFQVPNNQQFYSQQCLAEAMSAFFYVYEVKNILQINLKTNQSPEDKLKYANNMEKLKPLCPESKKKQLEDMIKILKEQKIQPPQNFDFY